MKVKWPLAVAGLSVMVMLSGGAAQGALVTISGVESWDGVANPHAVSGVTLTTNDTVTPPIYTYTIPDGMHITSTGELRTGNASTTLSFVEGGGGLQIDSGGNISPEVWPNVRWHGANGRKRNETTDIILDMNGNDITGSGTIHGQPGWPDNYAKHHVIIKRAGNVALSGVNMEQHDATMGDFVVSATGTVSIGSINIRATDAGGAKGDLCIRAPHVALGAVDATGGAPGGIIRLGALAAPYYGQRAWEHNSTANTLTLTGTIATRAGMSLVAEGVNLVLDPGFSTSRDSDRSVILRHGSGGTFTDNSTAGDYTSSAEVWHQESPPPDAKPQLIVNATETWNGTDNPRAADGVTLDAGAYTLPGDLYILPPPHGTFRNRIYREHFTLAAELRTGGFAPLRFGDSGNVSLVFTNGTLRLGTDTELYLTVGRWSNRTLKIDLGGRELDGGSNWLAGGGWTGVTGSVGARGVTITNAADITLGAITTVSHGSVNHPISIASTGTVTAGRLHTRCTEDFAGKDIMVQADRIVVDEVWTMGRTGGGNVTLRAEQVDVGTVESWAQNSGAAGNILIEALKMPELDPNQPINKAPPIYGLADANTLTAQGLLRTAVATPRDNGNVTLRGAVVTLESGFSTNINANATFTIHAGDAEPHALYFIDNSAAGPFTAVHDVKLELPPHGTLFLLR